MPKVPVTCQECGKEFESEPWAVKKGWDKYCSRECKGKAQSKIYIGNKSHYWKGGKIKRFCKACGKEFEVYAYRIEQGGGKYCSKMCSNKANAKIFIGKNHHSWKGGNAKRICQECGKEFEIYQGAIKKGKGKYCSRACHGKAQSKTNVGENSPVWKPKIQRICQECGKEFEVIPSWIEHGHGKYCSYECAGKAKIGIFAGEKSPAWKGGKIKLICQECGKEFEAYEASVKLGHKYCSTKCMGQGQSKVRVGENSSNWQGGLSFEPYCPKFNEQFKEKVRKWFDYQCVECGSPQTQYKLTVHHVYYNKKACCEVNDEGEYVFDISGEQVTVVGNPNKFVTLCRSCHTKTTNKKNRVYWARYFEEIINNWYQGQSWMD